MLKLRAHIEALGLRSVADQSEWESQRGSLEDRIQSEIIARRVR
jgi:hypothetical protein